MKLGKSSSLWLTGILGAVASIFSCTKKAPETLPSSNESEISSLIQQDIETGKGATAQAGDLVTVHYTGWLKNGTQFDSSLTRGEPFQFPLGAGRVIPGWDQGVAGMKEGGKRKLTIPSALGYGARGAGDLIPPNSTLIFEVKLLKVQKRKPAS